MPRNGSGNYNLPAPPSPFVAGTIATASDQNTRDNDVAQALSDSIARDGQTTITANLPMAGFKHTGVTAASGATTRTEYVGAGALQDGSVLWGGTTGGAADAYTLTAVPALSALVTGMTIRVLWHASNTGASTFNLSGTGVKNIKIRTGGGLADPRANDLRVGTWSSLLYDGTQWQAIGTAMQAATQAEMDAGASAIVAVTPAVFSASAVIANILNEIQGGWVDVASAATTSIGASGSANVRITDTTTITSFGVAAAGVRRRLRFAAALTLTHNATSLILPAGGSNILTIAGDTAVAISLGSGNWVVTEYVRAGGYPLKGVVDRAYDQYLTNTNITAAIPFDDTIPQSSEGTQIMSASITPKSTTNRVRVVVNVWGAAVSGQIAIALFNGGADAIAAAAGAQAPAANTAAATTLTFEHVPGSISAQTYTVRVGGVGTIRLNGTVSARLFGGVGVCSMIVEELAA